MDRHRPRSFAQASTRRHRRRGGRHYDPNAARVGPGAMIAFVAFGVVVLGAAGLFFYSNWQKKLERDREFAERPIRSKKLLEELKLFRLTNPKDEQIESVRFYVESRMDELMDGEKSEAFQMLASLKEQRRQADLRSRLDRLLSFVRNRANDPEQVNEVRDAAAQLEELLKDLDDDRVEDVKREIFVARGRSALAAATRALEKADEIARSRPDDYAAAMTAYENADRDLASVMVASKFPEEKDLRDSIASRMSDVAEKWATSPRGFESVPAIDLLQPKQFEVVPGEERAPWQASPGLALSWAGSTLRMNGVKPETVQKPGERAGVAFWSPSPKTAIRHYELRFRVRIVRAGFILVARQGTGYSRHLYGFEVRDVTGNQDPDSFFPLEGNSYDVLQRVYGKRIHMEVTPLSGDEVLPAAFDDQTVAQEGGIGFQLRPGAAIEIERIEIRILR